MFLPSTGKFVRAARREAWPDDDDTDSEEENEVTAEPLTASPAPATTLGPSPTVEKSTSPSNPLNLQPWHDPPLGPMRPTDWRNEGNHRYGYSSVVEYTTLRTSTTKGLPSSSPGVGLGSTSASPSPLGALPTHDDAGESGREDLGGHDKSSKPSVGPAVGGVLGCLVLVGVALLFWRCKRQRQRRRRKQQTPQQGLESHAPPRMEETKGVGQTADLASGAAFSPSTMYPLRSCPPPMPTILAPVRGNNYMTGLDTSDMGSMLSANDRTGIGDPFADGNSMISQPPPPYTAPPSYGPSSRNSSLRARPDPFSDKNAIAEEGRGPYQATRSPFDDRYDNHDNHDRYEEDSNDDGGSAVSALSTSALNKDWDNRSAVSDLSSP